MDVAPGRAACTTSDAPATSSVGAWIWTPRQASPRARAEELTGHASAARAPGSDRTPSGPARRTGLPPFLWQLFRRTSLGQRTRDLALGVARAVTARTRVIPSRNSGVKTRTGWPRSFMEVLRSYSTRGLHDRAGHGLDWVLGSCLQGKSSVRPGVAVGAEAARRWRGAVRGSTRCARGDR